MYSHPTDYNDSQRVFFPLKPTGCSKLCIGLSLYLIRVEQVEPIKLGWKLFYWQPLTVMSAGQAFNVQLNLWAWTVGTVGSVVLFIHLFDIFNVTLFNVIGFISSKHCCEDAIHYLYCCPHPLLLIKRARVWKWERFSSEPVQCART